MTNLNVDQLLALDPDEYDDELHEYFGDVSKFRRFLEAPLLERTVEYLHNFRAGLDAQLVRYRDEPETTEDWVKRTTALRNLVSTRLHMAQGRIRLEEKERARGGTNSAAWRAFAHRLAERLRDEPGGTEALRHTMTPFGDLSASDWLQRRLEKQPLRTGVNA